MDDKIKKKDQLLFKFKNSADFNYDNFFVSKSNYFAYNLICNWPKWEKNILNIYGEKFSGKTHLSNIFISKFKGKIIDEGQLNDNTLKELKLYENIIIDNFSNKNNDRLIYSLFNLVDSDFQPPCKYPSDLCLIISNVELLLAGIDILFCSNSFRGFGMQLYVVE